MTWRALPACLSRPSRGGDIIALEQELTGTSFAEARDAVFAIVGRTPVNGMRREVAVYEYRDESDNVLFQTVRYDPKDFRQRRPSGNGGWIWNLHGVRLVL